EIAPYGKSGVSSCSVCFLEGQFEVPVKVRRGYHRVEAKGRRSDHLCAGARYLPLDYVGDLKIGADHQHALETDAQGFVALVVGIGKLVSGGLDGRSLGQLKYAFTAGRAVGIGLFLVMKFQERGAARIRLTLPRSSETQHVRLQKVVFVCEMI